MSATKIKVCILLVFLSVMLAAVILITTNFCRLPILSKYWNGCTTHGDDNETSSSASVSSSMYSSPWKLDVTQEAIRVKQSALMKSYINSSVDPCDDFYEYACGNWEQVNPIPADNWQYSTISLLHRNLEMELKDLLSQPIKNETNPSAIDKTKLYYRNCMDSKAQAIRGAEPLLRFIKEMGGWPVLDENWAGNNFDWLQLAINTSFVGVLLNYEVEKNPTVPTEYTIFLKQTTLGMSNRDNFLNEENSKNLEAYRKFIETVLRLLNVEEHKARNVSTEIVDFEVQLANATLPPEATKTEPYLQPSIATLKEAYPYIDWLKYFSAVQQTTLSINQTVVIQLGAKYYVNLYYVLIKTNNQTLANYMIWRCVLFGLTSLGEKFHGAVNEFNAAVTGQVEPTPLWRICVNEINWGMGMATSSMFVQQYFDEFSKNASVEIVNSLKAAFDDNLNELAWIDEETKAYASTKANAMKIDAGYPNFVLSEEILNKLYKNVTVKKARHFESHVGIVKFIQQYNKGLLFKPYRRDQWFMPPTTVNALYDTGANRILILAGLLQPPVFHKHFPHSLNYGGIGMFLGHEVIHGFDDIGRKFDIDGNPLKWWSPKAIIEFEARQTCFLEQYGNFSLSDKSFKSIATISENLADNGGLRLAYKAYNKWKERNSDPRTVMRESFANMPSNEDQLFFLSFAQLFCAAVRPEALLESLSYEAHSPQKYRVLGALVNFEKFSDVYQCPENSPMNPSKKCQLW